MEIINLKSTSPRDEAASCRKITDIKQAVRDENRVNVFVDNEYCFSLDIAQLIDFKLKIGSELSEDDIEKYHKASEFGKLYQRTLEWVLVRPRSVRETRDHLFQKAHQRELKSKIASESKPKMKPYLVDNLMLEQVLSRLIEKHYIDDQKFAEYYVENRFVNKGISAKRMRMELTKKGIDSSIIDAVLNTTARNEADEIKKIITKKINRYDEQKLTSYLLRQGFDYELVRNLVRDAFGTD